MIRTLIDTGATTNFVSPQLLARLGTAWDNTSASLRLADNTEAKLIGKASAKLKIQNFSAVLCCYVTELCDEFDIILGNSFLVAHKAVLDYGRRCISLTRDGRKYTLKASSVQQCDTEVAGQTDCDYSTGKACMSKLILNYAQATRCVRNGCESFLVLVNTAKLNADSTVDDAAVIDDDDECTDGKDNRTAVPELAEHINASLQYYPMSLLSHLACLLTRGGGACSSTCP